ncbi:hypothetical protein PIB30_019035 [Stylosanthes scabra]|uniref:Uncharacterized protein n=1 Tax=Stylosanthes scabra TaxID=79078 RepID=A0ABU6S8F0_9FABA|nr:hypothetical protein [Stylosanthes scabra]
MRRGVHYEQKNLGRCASLLRLRAYHHIHIYHPQGEFAELRFPLVERWMGLYMARDSLGPRVQMWRMVLNGIHHREGIVPSDVSASHPSWRLVCLLLCFAIVEWH